MGRPLLIGIIIQARMGSSRLPGKVLKKIGNKSLLEHIFYRLKKVSHKVKIVVATTKLSQDNEIMKVCLEYKIDCFRGSELNVLERYYQCACKYNFSHIVRVTSDNPFIDIEELDNLIDLHLNQQADYSRSFENLPKGIGCEIFTMAALEKSYRHGIKDNHKEHVNEFIEEHEENFTICELQIKNQQKHYPQINLTVDTLEDYKKACFIVEHSSDEFITTSEAIRLCLQFV